MDLVLCDFFMPKMSGIAALKALRGTSADIPVIMMSGGIPNAMRSEAPPVDHLELARLMGSVATIAKPFRATALVALVQQHLHAGS